MGILGPIKIPPTRPSRHERQEHAGRVPQPGVPGGPRQTVAPEPSSPAYSKRSVRRTKERRTNQSRARRRAYRLSREREKLAKLPPTAKPKTYQGHKTAGAPELKELRSAKKEDTLKVNQRGYLTTPAVREAAKNLKRAKAQTAHSTGIQGPLVPQQKRFVKGVAKHTGLAPRAIAAQALAEQSGPAAAGYEASGEHNYLNIGPGQHFGSNKEAVKETSKLLNTSSDYAGIRATRGKGAKATIQAIAASPWGTVGSTMEGTLPQVHAKSNPKARKNLQRAKADAKSLGLKSGRKARFHYANSLPGWANAGFDQGYDASPGSGKGQILAVSKGKVIAVGAPGWPGGGGVTYKILEGPQRGKEIYAFESVAATVHPGQIVKRGQVIGTYAGGDPYSIETGYYVGNPNTGGHPLKNVVASTGVQYNTSTRGQTIGSLEFQKQILGDAVAVPASGSTKGYFVTAPTVGAYAAVTGTSPQQVKQKLKTHKLSVGQIFKRLKELGVEITPASTKAKRTPESKGSSTLKSLEAKYGVHTAA